MQVYLDRNQLQALGYDSSLYSSQGSKVVAHASRIVQTKSDGYDAAHMEFFQPFIDGNKTLVLVQRGAPGWFDLEKAVG